MPALPYDGGSLIINAKFKPVIPEEFHFWLEPKEIPTGTIEKKKPRLSFLKR